MPDARQWLRATNTGENDLAPTEDETSSALSAVRFRWSSRITKGVRGVASIIRNVRPQRSFRRTTNQPSSENESKYNSVGTRSLPHELRRQRSIAIGVQEHNKGKQRADRPSTSKNKSTTDVRTGHAKSFDWIASAGTSGLPDLGGSGNKPRRGSAPGHHAYSDLKGLQLPGRYSRGVSPQPTPVSQSPITTFHDSAAEERPRSRVSAWLPALPFRPKSKTPSRTPSHEASTSALPSGSASPVSPSLARPLGISRDLLSRRSEDAFRSTASRQSEDEYGTFNEANRAASWAQVGDYRRPSEDVTSVFGDDDPPQEVIMSGYGGIARSPVSSTPGDALSTASSMASLVAPPISAAHALMQRADGSTELPSAADPAAQYAASLQRHVQHLTHPTSPLSRPASDEELERPPSTFMGTDSSDGHTPSELDYADVQPSTSEMYRHEDDESDEDEEARPLEVRTRRPSWSLSDPRQSQEGYARPTIRI